MIKYKPFVVYDCKDKITNYEFNNHIDACKKAYEIHGSVCVINTDNGNIKEFIRESELRYYATR